jgi:hypothetical protein
MGLFDGPPVTDAQRDLVAKTDARTREWYLEAEITMLNMRISELEKALQGMIDMSIGVAEHDDITMIRQARKALLYTAADREAQDRDLGEKE